MDKYHSPDDLQFLVGVSYDEYIKRPTIANDSVHKRSNQWTGFLIENIFKKLDIKLRSRPNRQISFSPQELAPEIEIQHPMG